jgi:pimeloyl-ACP methyl ester carboxylesterase
MRSLVVYEPPINGDQVDPQSVADIRLALEEDRVDDAIRVMATRLAGITEDELAIAMGVPPIRKRLRDGARVVVRELEAIRGCDWSAQPITDVPTLIIRGQRSDAAVYPTADQMSSIEPGAEVAVMPGQGHLAHVFTPTAFANAVLDFVDRH